MNHSLTQVLPSIPRRPGCGQAPTAQDLLQDLLASSLVLAEDWEALPEPTRAELVRCPSTQYLLALLVEHRLLTGYQATRVQTGKASGLILGNYRILDRLGTGGMGVVYKAEHLRLRRPVAIKVLHLSVQQNSILLQRFFAEMRVVAQLQHPNIIGAIDIGEASFLEEGERTFHYFVMEYVPGQDLEQLIRAQGPLPPAKACDLIHQIANALAEAHKHRLVHRDIKPSNILVTPEGQAKLLDFGLARRFSSRLTLPGMILGTLDYMAPEQARDPGAVDIRADLYALGGTLFWSLSGQPPFSSDDGILRSIERRLTQPPPAVRSLRPDIPSGLEAVVARMMAPQPDDRYPTPQAVMQALLPFLKAEMREHFTLAAPGRQPAAAEDGGDGPHNHRVLIVDDEPDIRHFCGSVLQAIGLRCDEAANGAQALEAVRARRYDLVLLDVDMPVLGGRDVLQRLRQDPPCPHLKIIMFSGRSASDEMAQMLLAGADDYLTKPFSILQLRARVKTSLHFKDALDRIDQLNQHLLATNRELEQNLSDRERDLVRVRNTLVLNLVKLLEYRDGETGSHLIRLQRYCRCLAEEAAGSSPFASQIDANFIEMLECCVPLHDIGKVSLPDHILLKPGKLTDEERLIMQSHTTVGRDALKGITVHHCLPPAFFQMAIDIAYHHHERYDGQGYPDQLAGSAIPLAARITAICDVYDALRSRRAYKPPLSHTAAVQVITQGCPGQFDPALLQVFQRCAPRFEQTFRELSG